ncbi:TonB-dependent siderophore receptor [Shewanella mesophila]|uniref:TonB-dependent siderophore receptor n=1 Tax=Shewanella mesophila TaxID=2864208 RepID=UPI001C65A017|nr:TonB-dependent siderophore receptor [Shewanella mesophila]QYJ85792.1 TonB-dependent siderophore receptor [Shewanella mesophila]
MVTARVFSQTLLASSISLLLTASVSAQEVDQEIERILVVQHKQAYRGDVPLKQTPQAVSIVSSELLNDAGITRFQDALDFTSGVVRQNNFGGMWDSFAIRGFAGDENLPSGYIVNGFSAGRGFSGRRGTANIESIEVLKGPGSALYGRSEPGGTINIITKKPQFYQNGYLQISAGNYDTYRVEGDYTNALTEDAAFRINGSYEDAGSFRDTVNTQSLNLSPSFLYQLNDDTNLSYELEVLDQQSPFDRGVVVLNNDFNTVPASRFLGEPGDGNMDIKALGHQLVLQHQLTDDWHMQAGLSYRESSFEGFGTEVDLSPGRQLLYVDGETVTRLLVDRDFDATDLSGRLEFSGQVNTGALKHHVLVGIDAYDYQLDKVQNRWRTQFGSHDTTYSINLFNPEYGQSVDDLSPLRNETDKQQSIGAYVQDQIDINEHWQALFGIRIDRFSQDVTNNLTGSVTEQDQTATSPRFGLVYNFNDDWTVYSSYAEGFRPNSGISYDNKAFDPEQSKSYEVGMKWSLFNGDFNGTLALYKAEKSNVLSADMVHIGFSAPLGAAESKGLELDLNANITNDTRLSLAYAYTDAYTKNEVVNSDWGVAIAAGSPLINVAKNTANVTLEHNLSISQHDTLIGISANYVGDRLGETIDPNYILPSYTVVRLFTDIELADDLSLKLNIDNLFDEEYYASSYSALWTMPGAPRTYKASLKYRF